MSPLHHIGEFLRQSLMMVPLSWVRVLFIASLVILLIWVLKLPRASTTPIQGAKRWDENLKVGAALAIIVQILIYSFL